MAGWEEELVVLLHELGVMQEESKAHSRLAQLQEIAWRTESESKQQAQYADRTFWKQTKTGSGNESEDLNEASLMRREVESIVSQVVRVIQHGDLDRTLKEDVIAVLRALRLRAHLTRQAAAGDIASLEFGLAMLHFCRIVLQLNESATGEQSFPPLD